ncbi:MAG TPA: aminotransferase class I/II-fold pyridoxal phosphate-dependent enzyme [Rhodanobacteraceae bacterium]
MSASSIQPSQRLAEVRYAIRGPLARRARELDAAGQTVVKLNTGNPGRFGFRAPAHLTAAMVAHLADSDPYVHEQGLESARAAILAQQRSRGAEVAGVEHVFIGNGASELIDMALRALLNPGDEVLLPSPDYPLWSAATALNGGVPRYYTCAAAHQHVPDVAELEALCGPKTRAIVIINPNNPTGACYPRELLQRVVELAERHGLVVFADEIYDGIRYDGAPFTPLSSLTGKLPCVTYGGLSKVYRACGFRMGWATLSGDASRVAAYRDALQLLASLRLCANVTAQWAIEPALTGPNTIAPMLQPGGRLYESRRAVLDSVAHSRYLECVAPAGALYAFPAVRADVLPTFDDNEFAMRLLEEEHALVVPGSGFNVPHSRHFRVTLLPEAPEISDVFGRIERVLERMAKGEPAQRVA